MELSHPTWVRGLKLIPLKVQVIQLQVAPYVGAWIETGKDINDIEKFKTSHPTWVRGLKLINQLVVIL